MAGLDDALRLSTATLASGGTRFVVARRVPAHLVAYDFPILATDDAGGAFLTGDEGCTVGYRPAGGSFRLVYHQSNDPGGCSGTNVVDGIAATGDGYAALLTEGLNGDMGFPDTLSVQVGRFGRFGAPSRLSSNLQSQGSELGVVTDRDGSVTVAWKGCAVAKQGCGIYGEQGSVYSGFAGQPALIAAGAPNVRLSGLVADGAVAVQRCATHLRCTIAVALARADRQFSQPHPITAHGRRLLELKSDDHGDLLLVWSNDRGVLYAATKASGARRLSAPRRLSGSGVDPSTVTAAFGPHGEAIVAWSHSGHTVASVYSSSRR